MKNYRITFSNGPLGNKEKHYDVKAVSTDEAFKMAHKMSEANSGVYTNICVEEVKDGAKVVGLEVLCKDTVFKETFTDYMFIKADTEREAVDYYNEHYKGGRFLFDIGEEVEDGKCIRGKILNTYYTAGSGFHADATIVC